jgi:hypothetical protein
MLKITTLCFANQNLWWSLRSKSLISSSPRRRPQNIHTVFKDVSIRPPPPLPPALLHHHHHLLTRAAVAVAAAAAGQDDNIEANRALVAGFLASAATVVHAAGPLPTPRIHIPHIPTAPTPRHTKHPATPHAHTPPAGLRAPVASPGSPLDPSSAAHNNGWMVLIHHCTAQ